MPPVRRPAVPVAIVGIGCRFPGGVRDADSYWELMARGRCAIREIPHDRWSLDGFWDVRPDLPDRSYSKWGGFLDDVRGFDPASFGVSPRDAEGMDPQQRLLLMVAVEAAQDARITLATLRRQATGVFVGVSNVDYGLLQRFRPERGEMQAGTGTALSIVANRVSNRLDLSGPSVGVDTACSSALVAVDTACRHLADASCDLALAGGVNVLLDPRMFITFSRAHMLSPTGRLRAFDASADGFVRGEGAGLVLLRRLDDAIAAGDTIHAVIRSTFVNQDGRTGTITEPSCAAQIAMLRRALERAELTAADVVYAEAHGTGTPVGDPIEARALGAVLGGDRGNRGPLPIGSVKTNIGHLEPAAGIAGLIKTALVLKRGEIPPSLGFAQINPRIDLNACGLDIAGTPRALAHTQAAPCAVVNSFGFGGTNACAVLQAHVVRTRQVPRSVTVAPAQDEAPALPHVCVLSGPTQRHVEAFAARLLRETDCGGPLEGAQMADIAAALAVQRDHQEFRTAIIAGDLIALRDRLALVASGREPVADRNAPPQIIRGRARGGAKLVFTMTGQGGQWWAMGRELLKTEPVFRRVFQEFDREFVPVSGWATLDALLADETASRIDDAAITPAVMFAFQAGLAAVWHARGVTPDIVLGHSFGEVTAAYLAGGIGSADVARLVKYRGLIRSAVDRRGTMAAIGLGADAIEKLLPADGSIEIGGYNSPSLVTLTGDEAAIDALIARLNADDPTILTRKLALDFAYHSSWFEPVEERFKDEVGALLTSAPTLPVVSTVTGALNSDFSADYWWRNLRQPVLYQNGVETALDMGGNVFVELGPHRTLSSMTAACAAARGREVATVSTLDRRWGDRVSIAVATAQLWTAGVDIDWAAMSSASGRELRLPLQPWILRDIWSEPEEAARQMRPERVHPLLGRRLATGAACWQCDVSLATHPWLGDHRLDGACVMPAAAYIEMLAAAAREVLGEAQVELSHVAFPSALYLGDDDEVIIETRFDEVRRTLEIRSRVRGNADWDVRASARVFVFQGEVDEVEDTCGGDQLDVATFYADAAARGYGWGRQFRGLRAIRCFGDRASGEIEIALDGVHGSHLDPRAVDSALQLMLACAADAARNGVAPAGIDRIIALGAVGARCSAQVRVVPLVGRRGIEARVSIGDGTGPRVLIEGLRALPRRRSQTAGGKDIPFFVEEWTRFDVEPAVSVGPWQVLACDGDRFAESLVQRIAKRGLPCEIAAIARDQTNIAGGSGKVGPGPSSAGLGPTYVACAPEAGGGARFAWPDVDGGPGSGGHLVVIVPEIDTLPEACAATAAVDFVVRLGQALAVRADGEVCVVTRCGVIATDADQETVSVAHAAAIGALRTVAMELPELMLRIIDVVGHEADDLDMLISAVESRSTERELAIRSGAVLRPRLVERRAGELPVVELDRATLAKTDDFALRQVRGIGTDGLAWCRCKRLQPTSDEVAVEVHAAGLNFRDLMAVSGLLPADAEPQPAVETLGLEMSGIVVAVGADVRDVEIGAHVAGMGTGALRRFVTWPRHALVRAPHGATHLEAATIPSAFLTAHYVLTEMARVKRGETVLIHSAAGGFGLAAFALARRVGARVIATAGTLEKRDHLEALGAALVLDSRTLDFERAVRRFTEGRGVDVVLNGLGGDFIEKSLACVAAYGRFVELGKRDVWGNGAVALKAMRANVSLHVVDLAAFIRERSTEAQRLMGEVADMWARGEIAPLPATVFGASCVGEAFQRFSNARHIGKIVVDMTDRQTVVACDRRDGFDADPRGTYLVTGGSRGFGAAVARWLKARGAGRVVVGSRSGGASGANVEHAALDVRDATAVERLIAELAGSALPLKGIVHAAVEYDDAMLADMTREKIERVMAPKLGGALNLTRAVEKAGARLGFFVSFSSLAQVVGWPGQANYAAANRALEALAHSQRARGIRGQCINWGALGESGHVARRGQMQGYLESAGWVAMTDAQALDALGQALVSDAVSITVASADWQKLAKIYPVIAGSPRLAPLVGKGAGDRAAGGLSGLTGAALQVAAVDLVREQAAKVLRSDATELKDKVRLDEAGIDSLSSFELRNRIGQALGREVPMARYTAARTFEALAALVAALAVEHRQPGE